MRCWRRTKTPTATFPHVALTEMQAVVAACAKQKGCELPKMLATYERLLKASPQDGDGDPDSEDEDPIDEGDLATTGAGVPESADAASLLSEEGQRFVRMVQFNPAVQAGIRRWLTDMRPSLMDSYENYRYMQHLMSPAFKRHGLPEALLFGIMAKESNGKVHVGSRAGAVGPLQFMPATGRRFGLGNDGTGFDTRYDRSGLGRRSGAVPRPSACAARQQHRTVAGRLQRRRGPRTARVPRQRRAQLLGLRRLQPVPGRDQGLRADGGRRGVAVPAPEGIRHPLAEGELQAGGRAPGHSRRRSTS